MENLPSARRRRALGGNTAEVGALHVGLPLRERVLASARAVPRRETFERAEKRNKSSAESYSRAQDAGREAAMLAEHAAADLELETPPSTAPASRRQSSIWLILY